MHWKLVEKSGASQEITSHDLKSHSAFHITVEEPNLAVVNTDELQREDAVARITIEDWAIKLQAYSSDVSVQPVNPRFSGHAKRHQTEEYTLPARESIFLREHDSIHFANRPVYLVLQWDPTEIQVNSSITGEGIAAEADASDAEEQSLSLRDTTAKQYSLASHTGPSKETANSTPLLSAARSDLVEETPTANRQVQVIAAAVPDIDGNGENTVEGTPAPDDHASEEFSTAPITATVAENANGDNDDGSTTEDDDSKSPQHVVSQPLDEVEDNQVTPQPAPNLPSEYSDYRAQWGMNEPGNIELDETDPVEEDSEATEKQAAMSSRRSLEAVKIPMKSTSQKRLSPALADGTDLENSPGRVPKRPRRAKTNDESQDSRLSEIIVDTKRTAPPPARTPRRGRNSGAQESATTPPATAEPRRSVGDEELYDGPKLKVAFSNSSIDEDSRHVAFLKSHSGALTKFVKEGSCNVLCVRTGPLKKSMKLLMSVALGIPIVTEKWLIESARKGVLLAFDSYIPTVPVQEREWEFSMSGVWGQPQVNLLEGQIICFTPALKKMYEPFKEAEEVCKAVGAKRVISKAAKDVKDSDQFIILAAGEDDQDAMDLAERQIVCYHRDLLTLSILRGEFDLGSDEFRITPVSSQQKKRGRPKRKI